MSKHGRAQAGPLVEFFEEVGQQADEGPVVEEKEARALALIPGREHSGR
jgi:hypothetical protein